MKFRSRILLGLAVAAAGSLTGPGSWVVAAPARACAALGTYTIVPNASAYAASAFPTAALPLVTAGTATVSAYAGCGTATQIKITTDGSGALLRHPVTPMVGDSLRASGDLLLQFTGTVHGLQQGSPSAQGPQAVQVSGVATYARVTTKGTLKGKQVQLAYSVTTITVSKATGQLRLVSDYGGAFSLSLSLPGPSVGKIASNLSYFALAAKNPAKLKSAKAADPKL